jgi:hypothetical protein
MHDARKAFIAAWRERHPHDVWCVAWVCPLCREAVQPFDMETQTRAVKCHTDAHGQDWLDLMAARPAPGGG